MSMNREQSLAIPTKEEWMAALTMRHGEERQKAFSAATVAVCGLGGLGSNIATALARAGIGKLILMTAWILRIFTVSSTRSRRSECPRQRRWYRICGRSILILIRRYILCALQRKMRLLFCRRRTLYVKRLTIRKRRQCLRTSCWSSSHKSILWRAPVWRDLGILI
mgnify:CR=1 FL=1